MFVDEDGGFFFLNLNYYQHFLLKLLSSNTKDFNNYHTYWRLITIKNIFYELSTCKLAIGPQYFFKDFKKIAIFFNLKFWLVYDRIIYDVYQIYFSLLYYYYFLRNNINEKKRI